MKAHYKIIVAILIASICVNAYAQHNNTYIPLWLKYSDSAYIFGNQGELNKAISYYIKAKAELIRDSAESQSYIWVCDNLAFLYMQTSQIENGEQLFLEVKNIQEKVVGKKNLYYAARCINLANFYLNTEQYSKSIPLFIEAKKIIEDKSDKNDPEYSKIINNLAKAYYKLGKYNEALVLLIEAKELVAKVPGMDNIIYSIACNNLGSLYTTIGQFENAQVNFLEAKNLTEKLEGLNSPNYANNCINLAFLYETMGQFKNAEKLFLEAKDIRANVVGVEHPDYASSCDGLAGLYLEFGQFKEAESLFLEAKKVRENYFSKDHPEYARSCNNLANLYMHVREYIKSESLYIEALQIFEKTLGKSHPDYMVDCNNMASFYMEIGEYKKAETLLIDAKQNLEKTFGKNHLQYALIVNTLGNLYAMQYQYEKAEQLLTEVKQIRKNALGDEHPIYASSCNNLGMLYLDMRQNEKAEVLLLEGLQILKKAFGNNHPDYSTYCVNLGIFYKAVEKYQKSESFLLDAKANIEMNRGKENEDYISCCINLADLYWNMGTYKKAETYFLEIPNLRKLVTQKIFLFTSETEQQSYLLKNSLISFVFLSYCVSKVSNIKPSCIYDLILSTRNLTLQSTQELNNIIYNTSDENVKQLYGNWIDLRKQIAALQARPGITLFNYEINLAERSNTLEKELRKYLAAFNKMQAKNEINWKDIQSNLKENEAAVEFLNFPYYNGRNWTDSIYFIATVVRKDKSEPIFVKLFEKQQLYSIIDRSNGKALNERVNALYAGDNSLYELIWKPLEKYLKGISRIYFATTGELHEISLSALPVNDTQMLGNKYQLGQLNTTATVTENAQNFISGIDTIRLFGGIHYDTDSVVLKKVVSGFRQKKGITRPLSNDLSRGAGFQYLPGTKKEIDEIYKQAIAAGIHATIDSSVNASEERIKALNGKSSPSVLFIGTHGFFFPDPKLDKKDNFLQHFEFGGKALRESDNPLFRSGLAFAGANYAWYGKPLEGIEDGILTAYEVSNMYLPNTKLVVLSACETGLGDIQGSEGVYGLQRAFKMAGVENLVMSLWKVPDPETAEFMQLFFKNLLGKQSISDAFYNTQQMMKDTYPNKPYNWAAWVLIR